jgi:hypothetical protein
MSATNPEHDYAPLAKAISPEHGVDHRICAFGAGGAWQTSCEAARAAAKFNIDRKTANA